MAFNYRPMTPKSYVAFVKATETLWNKMEPSQRLDNVLYFVVDGPDDSIGKLYLGNTLIADGNGITDVRVDNLLDVDIDAINGGDVLMYNMSTSKWENVSLASQIGNLIKVFSPASESSNGTVGLVPAPQAGQQDLYLKGDGSWANPTEAVALKVETLKTSVDKLIGTDKGVSVRVIATDVASKEASAAVAKLVANAPEKFNTLKEIADWIQEHPSTETFTALSNKVTSLNDLVNGNTEKGITGLVSQVSTLNSTVSTLNEDVTALKGKAFTFTSDISSLKSGLATVNTTLKNHSDRIDSIESRLVWHELYEVE